MPSFDEFFDEMRAKLRADYAKAASQAEKDEIKALLNQLVDAKEAHDFSRFRIFVGRLDELRKRLDAAIRKIRLDIDEFLLDDLDHFISHPRG